MLSTVDIATSCKSDHFNLIVMPTEQCNFRCTYCYEDFKIGYMSPELERALCALIKARAPELSYFNISWFGGEPLLSTPAVERITTLASNHMKTGGVFQSNMSTNGALLTANTIEKLSKAGVTHYQISLDGLPEHHNKTRLNRAGKGTFEKIWTNAIECQTTDINFEITFRLHITRANAASIAELLKLIIKQFSGDHRFKVYFKPVEKLSGQVDMVELVTGNEANNLVNALEAKASEAGMYDSRAGADICYASKPNSLVLRANGRIAKCTVAFNDDRNDIGCLTEDGALNIDQDKLRPWIKGLLQGDEESAACPYPHL